MKKLLLLFLALMTIMSSCMKDPLAIEDRRFDPVATMKGLVSPEGAETSKAYINKSITITLMLKNELDGQRSYDISVSPQEECVGILKLKTTGETVAMRTPISYKTQSKNDLVEFEYIPTSIGIHKLEFSVSNGHQAKNVTVNFDGIRPIYNIEFIGLPDKDSVELERPLDFKMSIEELLGQTDLSKKVKASVTFTKGSGIISTPTRIWDGLTKGTLLKSVQPATDQAGGVLTRAVAEGETASVFEGTAEELHELIVGENQLSILSTQFGPTDVNFTLEAAQGSKQEVPMSIKSKLPDFTVSAAALPGRILVGRTMKAHVAVDNKEHPTNKEFSISYLITPKNAVQTPAKSIAQTTPMTRAATSSAATPTEEKPIFLKVIRAQNETTIVKSSKDTPTPLAAQTRSGSTVAGPSESTSGTIEDIVELPIKLAGEQIVRMIASDKFGSEKKSPEMVIKAEESGFSFQIKEGSSLQTTINKPTIFTIVASDMTVQEKVVFKSIYTLSKGVGVLKMGDQVIEPGQAVEVTSTNAMSFTASTTDEAVLTFNGTAYNAKNEVYDEKDVSLIIMPVQSKITVTVPEKLAPALQQPYKLPISIIEEYYEGEFTVLFERNDGQGILSTPTVSEIAHNSSVKAKSAQPVNFTYKPTSAGNHQLVFTISDIYGQKEVKTITFAVDDTDFNFTRSEIAEVMQTGKASPFTMKLSKEYYPVATFSVGLIQKQGNGVFKMGSQTVANNGSVSVKRDLETAFSYTPNEAGDHLLQLSIDVNGQIIEKLLTFTVPVHIKVNASPAEGGEASGAGVFAHNTQQSLSVKLAEGYSLDSWLDGSGQKVSKANPFTFSAKADGIYTASLTQNAYKVALVSFPVDGGTTEGAGDYHYNKDVSLLAKSAAGYEFLDWHKDGKMISMDNPYKFSMPLHSQNLTARFGKSSFTITLSSEAGGQVSGAGRYEFNSEAEITTTPDKGYAFAGLFDAGGKKVSDANPYTYKVKAENVAFRAKFTPINYQITATASEGGQATGGGSVTFGTTTLLKATPKAGYKLDGWYDVDKLLGTEASLNYEVTEAANKTIIARFSPISYAITVNATTGGSAIGGGDVAFNGSTTLIATAATGYKFDGWYDGSKQLSTVNTYIYQITEATNKTITAKFSPISFTITVNFTPGGNASGGGSIAFASTTTLTATPSSGNQFDGWYDGSRLLSKNNPFAYEVAEAVNKTLTAQFSPISYTITPQASTGGTVTGGGVVAFGSSTTLTASAIPGYDFEVWMEGTKQVSSANPFVYQVNSVGDKVITAKFKLRKFTVAVNAEAGGIATGGGTIEFNSETVLKATPATGRSFDGWYIGGSRVSMDNPYQYRLSTASDVVVTAKFAVNKYQVTASAGVGGTTTGTGSYDHQSPATLRAIASEGYTFDSWMNASGQKISSDNPYVYTVGTVAATFTAQFKINSYTLILNAEAGGTASGGGTYNYGSMAILSATPSSGNRFDGWYDGSTIISSNTSFSYSIPATNKMLTAKFVPINYQVTVIATGGGTASGSASVNYGASHTITAAPNASYKFSGWYEGGNQVSTAISYTFTMPAGDRTLEARFMLDQFNVTPNSGGGGNVSGGGNNIQYNASTTLTAIPDAGRIFEGWYDGDTQVSAENPWTFNVTASKIYQARFSLGSYALNVSTNGGGSVAGGGESHIYGTIRTITATAAESHTFAYWTKNGGQIAGGTSITISVEETNNYVAVFTIKRVTISVSGNDVVGGGTFDYGTSVTLTTSAPPMPNNVKYTTHDPMKTAFLGWKEGGKVVSSSLNYTLSATSDRTLLADWEVKMIEVSLAVIDQKNIQAMRAVTTYGSITIYYSYDDSEGGRRSHIVTFPDGQSSIIQTDVAISEHSILSNIKIDNIICTNSQYGAFWRVF